MLGREVFGGGVEGGWGWGVGGVGVVGRGGGLQVVIYRQKRAGNSHNSGLGG